MTDPGVERTSMAVISSDSTYAIVSPILPSYSPYMATIIEIEKLALNLADKERATLAANLLNSLPGVLSDEDEGVAEALRRDAEASVNPDQTISLAQLDSLIESRRR